MIQVLLRVHVEGKGINPSATVRPGYKVITLLCMSYLVRLG